MDDNAFGERTIVSTQTKKLTARVDASNRIMIRIEPNTRGNTGRISVDKCPGNMN
jgi:hypothetical protein